MSDKEATRDSNKDYEVGPGYGGDGVFLVSRSGSLQAVACWPHLPAQPKITQHFSPN